MGNVDKLLQGQADLLAMVEALSEDNSCEVDGLLLGRGDFLHTGGGVGQCAVESVLRL
jgi:hypothetical protein